MSTATLNSDGRPKWFTSSYSNGAGGECVECSLNERGALVRDSKSSGEFVIAVGGAAWGIFMGSLAAGTELGSLRHR